MARENGKHLTQVCTTMIEFGKDGLPKWGRVDPPLRWENANAMVVADRHLPDGTRQHMIRGKTPDVRIVDNAEVVGQDDAPDAEYSSTPSHLSSWRRQKKAA